MFSKNKELKDTKEALDEIVFFYFKYIFIKVYSNLYLYTVTIASVQVQI